jgi:hypothetical protein
MKFYLARYKEALSVRYMEAPQDWIMTVVSVTEVVPARDVITSLCIEADIKRETRSFCTSELLIDQYLNGVYLCDVI